MDKSFIRIGGADYRVEVNWNALTAFLAAIGRDTLDGLADISTIKPSEITALMAAAIKEGERMEGREFNLTALDLGAIINTSHVGEFMDIYISQSRGHVEDDDAKKKDGRTEV